jgi:hypothetical protein
MPCLLAAVASGNSNCEHAAQSQ